MERTYENNIVLFVDDEENILKSLKRGLMREKYKKLFASSGEDALRMMKHNDVSVIVTDMRMPGMNGLELLRQVKSLYPDTVKIVLSGYTQLPQVLATVNQVDIFKFITKPWDMEHEFKKVINEAIDFYNVKFENEILRKSISKKNELYQKLLKSNDEKLRSIKRDFQEVFRIQQDTYMYLSELCKKKMTGEYDETEYDTAMEQVSDFFSDLPYYFPSEFTEMQMTDFAEEVNRIVFSLEKPDQKFDPVQSVRHVGFVGMDTVLGTYRGNFKLLFLVMKKIFRNIMKCNSGNIYNVIMKKGESYEVKGDSMCKLTLLIDETMPLHEGSETVRTGNAIILDHLMQSLGGGFQMTLKNDKVIIVLEMELQQKIEAVES